MIGRENRAIHTSGGPKTRAARSGLETAAFLGIISPTTTWRPTMMNSAIAMATAWAAVSLMMPCSTPSIA